MLIFQPLLRPKKPASSGRAEEDVLVDAGEIKRLQTASLNMEGEVERGRNGPIDLQPLSKRKGLARRDEGALGGGGAKCFMRRESGHGDGLAGGSLGCDWLVGWLVDSLSDLRGSSVNVSIGRRTKVEIHPLAQGSGTPKRVK